MSATTNSKNPVLTRTRIWIPLTISVAAIFFIFYFSFDPSALDQIPSGRNTYLWLLAGVLLMLTRISLYSYRLRLASGGRLSWKQGYQVAILWDFASAVTPSTVGGFAVAIFMLNREKINLGESTAMVMLVSFLDQLFYIVLIPILILFIGTDALFPDLDVCDKSSRLSSFISWADNIWVLFIIGYSFLFGMVVFLTWGLFINPKRMKKVFVSCFNIPFFRRWKKGAQKTADGIIVASDYYKSQPLSFWFKIGAATFVAWTCRFLIASAVILAMTGGGDQLVVFSRQFVLWIITLIPSTPGASGVADLSFIGMLCEFIPGGLEGPISQLWRLMTYYSWAILGAFILPGWYRRTGRALKRAKLEEDASEDGREDEPTKE